MTLLNALALLVVSLVLCTLAAPQTLPAFPYCNGVNPPAYTERCDGLDNDCDGLVDEGVWLDADNDGFSSDDTNTPSSVSCTTAAPLGRGVDFNQVNTDCDDSNPAIYPGAPIVPCNGILEDCNPANDVAIVDRDGDGESAVDPTDLARAINDLLCTPEQLAAFDCNDDPNNNGALQNHGLSEDDFPGIQADGTFGDGLDNNCDGIVDNGFANNVLLVLSGQIINLESARKRTVYAAEAHSSSSSSSDDDNSCTNLLIELTLTNKAANTAATNVIVEGKIALPKGSVLKASVLGQLGRYGVKVDIKTGTITWVQFKLDKHDPAHGGNSQTIQLPVCTKDPNGPVSVKLAVVRLDQKQYLETPATLELRQ